MPSREFEQRVHEGTALAIDVPVPEYEPTAPDDDFDEVAEGTLDAATRAISFAGSRSTFARACALANSR